LETAKAKETAIDAATKAGKFIKERVGNFDRIDYKSAFNLVTDVDKGSEKLILEILRSQFPEDGILAEEGGGNESTTGRR
jgi:myo-inositol-1(or 4)-monophosphatase